MPWANGEYHLPDFASQSCGPNEFGRVIYDHNEVYEDQTKLSESVVKQLCDTAYHASMKAEEGAYCRARFVRPQQSVMTDATASMIRFGTPIVVRRASDIKKMGILARESHTAFLLDADGSVPRLVGLVDYRWRSRAHIGGPWIDYEPLPGLHLEIVKPGILKSKQFQLAESRITSSALNWQDMRSPFHWHQFESAHPIGQPLLYSLAKRADALRIIWIRMWPLLLESIRARGHGGMLVLEPEDVPQTSVGKMIYNFNLGSAVKALAGSIYDQHLVVADRRNYGFVR